MGFAFKFNAKTGFFIDEKTGQEINHEKLQDRLNDDGVICPAGRGHVMLIKLIDPNKTLARLIKSGICIESSLEPRQEYTLPNFGLDCPIKNKYCPPKRVELDYLLAVCCTNDYAKNCEAFRRYWESNKRRR